MFLWPRVVKISRAESIQTGKVVFTLTLEWLFWKWEQFGRWKQDEPLEWIDPPKKR